MIEESVGRTDIALDAPELTRGLLKRDGLLLLVDGLDEAPVSRWLEEAVRQLPKSTFVVTSLDGHAP